MKLDISGANFNTKSSAGNWMEASISFFSDGSGILIYHLNPAFKMPTLKTGENPIVITDKAQPRSIELKRSFIGTAHITFQYNKTYPSTRRWDFIKKTKYFSPCPGMA